MKAASKYILRYFVVGVVTCLSLLLLSCPVKAATSDNFAGHWYVWEENVNVSGNQWISYQNVLIVTNDPLAMGQIQVNNTTSGPSNFVQTLDFSGTYTFYSHLFEQPFTLQNGLMPVATSNGRAFTSYTPIQSSNNIEIIELSSSQINSLINSIQASGSYDDTDLLNKLAIINGVLDNIDTSTSATASSVAALNTTASNIYTALQNIDNAIDMISWIPVTNTLQYKLEKNGEIYTSAQSTQSSTIYPLFLIDNPTRRNSSIVKVTLPFDRNAYYSYTINSLKAFFINSGTIYEMPCEFYYQINRNMLTIYMYNFRSNTNNIMLEIVQNTTWRVYEYDVSVSYITDSDIEYWQLLSFFLQAASQKSDTSAIDNENQDLSDQVDDYIEQENQLIGGFDNAMTNPAVIPTSNPDANLGSWGSNFISSLSLFSVLVGNVVGTSLTQWGNPIYLLLNFSLVFGFALLIIGKRG